jgi:malonyl-CoA O-methyltransferase
LTLQDRDWKQRVATAFDRATLRYHQQADVQRAVAGQLAGWMEQQAAGQTIAEALEIGCGTGFLTARLARRWPHARWLISDIAPAMVQHCRERLGTGEGSIEFQVLDGERIAESRARWRHFDLICSNLAFQWFTDLPQALPGLMDRLRPGGWLIFTTLAADNFSRVYARYPWLAETAHPAVSESDLHSSLQSCGATATVRRQTIMRRFPDLRGFLDSLKQIGATTSRQLPGGSGRHLRAALKSSSPAGRSVSVDYSVLFVAARRPS